MKIQTHPEYASPSASHPILNLLKDIHRRIGYPLGKLHYKLQMLAVKLKEPGSPIRYLRGIYYTIVNFREHKARKLYARNFIQNLKPGIKDPVEELRKVGFSYFTDQIDPALMAELNRYNDEVLTKRSETARAVATHPFFFPLLNQETDLATDSILVRFALQESILQAMTTYFGAVPILTGISVTESRSIEATRALASQQWHLDYSLWNSDQIYLWVYLTDVTSLKQGPLTLIPIPGSRKVKNDFFPRRIQDAEIEATGLTNQMKHALGARSSAFLVNNYKCYHMGSRLAPGERRVVYQLSFGKPGNEQNFIKITTPVTEREKLVIAR